jgi:alpha-2-macroglobulin
MLGRIEKISEICKSKKFRIIFLGLIILCAVIGGYKAIPYPQIIGTDIPDTIYKVSFNAPFTLHFSQVMNKKSVESSFNIHPKIEGDFSWPDSKTLEFNPSDNLNIGDDYRIIIGAEADSIYGKSLGSDIALHFLVTGPPFVKFVSPYFPIVGPAVGQIVDPIVDPTRLPDGQVDEPIDSPSADSQSVPIVSSDQVITVMFDRPMQWPSQSQLAMGENLLLIDPPVSGSYRFLGMSAFQFIPDSWPTGTRFSLTIPAGMPARDGGKTEEEFKWSIETSPLRVIETVPSQGDDSVDINTPIKVIFSQPVILEQIRPGVNALLYPSNDLDAAENPKTDGFFNTEVIYSENSEGKQDKTILIFKPTFPYLNETEYRFLIKAGLTSASGDTSDNPGALGMKEDFELDFKTKPAAGITEFIAPSDGKSSIFVTFATQMTVGEIIKGLSFTPELPAPPGIILNQENTQAEIICQFNPNTNYTFKLKSGISDAAGEEIKNDFKKTFISPSIQSKLRWEDAGSRSLFSTEESPGFTVRSNNTNELILKLCQVSDQDFIKTDSEQSWENYKCYSEPHAYPLPSGDNETTQLNLAEIFGKDLNQGAYFFSAETNDDQRISRIFFITNTSVVLKKSANSLLIWAKDILTGKPVPRMEFVIYSHDGEEITRGVTDGDGVNKLTREIPEGVYAIGRKNLENENRWAAGNEYWKIPADKNSSVWIMSGESRLFLTTDKNVIFSGDKLSVQGILRIDNDAQLMLPEDKQVKLALENTEQDALITETLSLRRNGSFDAELEIPQSAPNAVYRLTAYTARDEILSSNDVLITVLNEKPAFEMQWINPQTDFYAGDIALFNLSAHYALGMPAANLNGKWELYKKPYYFSGNFGGDYYSFGKTNELLCQKGACESEETLTNSGEFAFDTNGLAQIALTDKDGDLPSGYEYKLAVSAQSVDGKEVLKEINFKVHPGDYYTGLSLKHNILSPGDNAEGSLIAVHPQKYLLKDKKIKISLIHTKNGEEGKTWYEKIINTDAEPKDIEIPLTSKMPGGTYTLRAESQDGGSFAELELYLISDDMGKMADNFAVYSDQPEYFVGGKAYLLMNYPGASSDNPVTALITYERGGILGYQVTELNKPVTKIEIPITEEMTPNINVSSIIINGKSQAETADINLLAGKRGRVIGIDILSSPLAPAPGEEVTIQVRTYDYQNRPVSSAVTLNLAKKEQGQNAPELTPFDYFYKPRFSQISTSSNMTSGKVSADLNQIPSIMTPEMQTGKIDFSAYFNPVILTDSNGYAEVKIVLPDEYAVWQISAIATNEAKNFGSATYDLPVIKQFTIYPVTPAFVIPGDQATVGALVTNSSGEDAEAQIELVADDIEIKQATKTIFVKSGHTEKVEWDVGIKPISGKNSLDLTFQSNENHISVTLPVVYFNISERIEESGLLSDKWDGKMRIGQDVIENMGGLNLSVSAAPVNIIDKYINAIKQYSYSSVEKSASELIGKTIFYHPESGDITVKETDDTSFANDNAGDGIKALASEIMSCQNSDGGYPFWQNAESNAWLTAYVSLALYKAGISGAPQDSAIQFIWNNFNDIKSISDQFFVLWALSEMGQYDTRSAINLFQSRGGSTIAGRAFLLMNFNNLIEAGQKSVYPYLERLQSELADTKTIDGDLAYFEEAGADKSDTDTRATAVMLLALGRLGDENPLIPSIVKYLASLTVKPSYYFNSQEGIWIAMALAEFVNLQSDQNPAYTVKTRINNQTVIDENITSENADKVYQSFAPLSSLKKSNQVNEISISKDGVGPLYFDADLTYYPSNDKILPVEQNVIITRDYYTLEDYAEKQPLAEMNTGNLYRGVLTIIAPEDLDYAAIEEYLPAGIKALSFNPKVASKTSFYEQETFAKTQGLNWVDNPLWNFDHYEIKDEKLLLFAEHLPAGVYKIDYLVQAGLPGKYNHLPASIRQLFSHSVYARTNGEWVEIK